ncbi:hypothetical protein BS78_01G464300 [Paspalum vaginatum]|nr:hypothetical protein BS78_01G464300 [Paspalum vaginatum]
MRSLAAVFFVVLAAALAAGAASARFVDPPDADVPAGTHPAQIGRFAVLVYSMNRGSKLKYVSVSDSVVRRAHQGGVRYSMVVTAADGASGATAQYQVLVWGIPGTYQWMLLEFKKIN